MIVNKVSIITVSYNSAATIRDTLESVFSQCYPSIEYILVDGSSNDGSVEIIQEYADKIATLIIEPDKGIYEAMNKGIAAATGDLIGFLNADDFFSASDVIQSIVLRMEAEKLDACYGDLVYVDRDQPSIVRRVWRSRKFDPALLRVGWIPAHPTFYAKRELLLAGFNEKYRLAADYDLMLRILTMPGVIIGYLPRVLVKMRTGGVTNNSLRNIVKQNIEIIDAAKKRNIGLSLVRFIGRKLYDRLAQRFAH